MFSLAAVEFSLSSFMTFESFILTFLKKKEESKKPVHRTTESFLGSQLIPATTHRLTLNLPSTFLNYSSTTGIVLIILLAGGTNQSLQAALVPQFSALMAASELMRVEGNPTGWSAGVRSAGKTAIISHHSLYWPPPIGFLLNLKHVQLFLRAGNES